MMPLTLRQNNLRVTQMSEIIVGGVETFSTVDFPGKLAAVVFMQGCPWRCPFCHNTELQPLNQSTNFIWGNFLDFLKKRQGILEAVVFSGGEPLTQNALPDAIKEVKSLGYQIGLHTGGYRPDLFAEVLPLVDWVGFDIKTSFNEEKYNHLTGSTHFTKVMQSLEKLIASHKAFECRTTCDPRHLEIEDIYNIGKELSRLGVKEYYLQKYRPIPSDTESTDADCEKFFHDEALQKYLKETFPIFDNRF